MRANELLALTVGTEITWKELQLDGQVTAHGPRSLTIRWSANDMLPYCHLSCKLIHEIISKPFP